MRILLAFLLFAAAMAGSAWSVLRVSDAVMEGSVPTVALDAWAGIAPQIDRLAADPGKAREIRVVFLGDSTSIAYPVELSIPLQLQNALALASRPRQHVRVKPLAFSGMNPFDYYYLSEPVTRTQARQIVMNVNLGVFSEPVRAYFSRPELAGWIPPRRWLEAARLPLHWQGTTFDELIFRSALVHFGAAPLWHRASLASVRLEKAYRQLSRRAQGRKFSFWGPFTARDLWLMAENGKLGPQDAEQARERYGIALDGVQADHPILRLLGAAVSRFAATGIAVTVYVAPINVERLAELKIRNEKGLAQTMTRLRAVVESAGGNFVDLHALVPDEGFRDPTGHLAFEGDTVWPGVVARSLAQSIVRQPTWPPARPGN